MATADSAIATFRDPAGSLHFEGERVVRRVDARRADAALQFLQSSLAQEWVEQGRLEIGRAHV